jgi:hypothetical protein
MQYPLIDRELLAQLRLVHAFFNTSVMLLFFYHGWIGLAIRRARTSKGTLPFALIKRHRKMGPILTILGGLGFSIGLTLVLLDTGNVFEYASHFIVGCLIVLLIAVTFLMSRKIKGRDSSLRTPHFVIGLAILFLYLIEFFLGIGALL